jgi:signal transduction histidine kinase
VSQVGLFGLSAILTALAFVVWRAQSHHSVNRWFASKALCLAFWVSGIAGLQGGANLDAWGRFTIASASFIPATFLGFTRCYPTPSRWPSSGLVWGTLIVGTALAGLSLTTSLVVYDNILTPHGLTRKSGPLYPVFVVYFIVVLAAGLGVFIDKWRQARGLARAQLQYLGAGIIIASAGGIGINLLLPLITGRSTYSWFGPYFTFIFVVLVAHAIIRHSLMDLRPVINRGITYILSVSLLSVAIVTIGRLAAPAWPTQTLTIPPEVLVIALVTFIMLATPAKSAFDAVVDPYLHRGRLEHSSALRGATRRLSRLMQPAELAAELHRLLYDALVPESFVMLIRPFEGNLEPVPGSTPISLDSRTLDAMLAKHNNTTVIVVNPYGETGISRTWHEALRASGVEVLVTLGRRGQLLGVALLGPRRSGDAYFKNDLVFIESLADLASIALENALLYAQRIQILEYSDRLLESLDSAVVAIDVGGRITSFNPAATKLLGVSDEYRGALMHVLPSEIGWALVLAISGGWHPREVEVTIDHSVRGVLYVILSTAVLHDDEKRVSGALVVVTDLSAVKALERNQRRVEHLAIMARFYAGIAHEIRNPLAAISNFIAMLPDRFDDPEYRDAVVRILPMEVSRIVRLADRLRLMAPSEGGKLSIVSLSPLLHDIVAIHSPTAQEQHVKIELRCPDELPKIQGDPGQIVQLFVNLLRNAVEAMPDGGIVTIEAEHIPSRLGADSIVVRVLDEGTGIDPTVKSKIFDPFFTTKPSGTGLGLSICREIADFHRARLALFPRSVIDGGTVAEVEFSIPSPESPST